MIPLVMVVNRTLMVRLHMVMIIIPINFYHHHHDHHINDYDDYHNTLKQDPDGQLPIWLELGH